MKLDSESIKKAIAYGGTSVNRLAKELGQTQPNLLKKINRETITDDELEAIAKLLDCEHIHCFRFPDSTVIATRTDEGDE